MHPLLSNNDFFFFFFIHFSDERLKQIPGDGTPRYIAGFGTVTHIMQIDFAISVVTVWRDFCNKMVIAYAGNADIEMAEQ